MFRTLFRTLLITLFLVVPTVPAMAVGIDPGATTTAPATVDTVQINGDVIGQAGTRAKTEIQKAALPWFLVMIMVLGVGFLFRKDKRVAVTSAGLAIMLVFVWFLSPETVAGVATWFANIWKPT